MTDVVDLIEQDHREVEQMFAEFESTHDAAVATRICDELVKHTYGEERAVYPTIADKVSGGEELADEGEDEHKEARQLIGRVRNTTDESHLTELMSELKQAIAHHVREEETEMLPRARKQIGVDERAEMGRAFEEAKDAAGRKTG